ncbi:MAG: phosphonate metabolism protein/1,5-bisphosphokinase (PRPP-forming) PhnN [Hyphomicrobiaceae bacterium]|nr:phosphonate metabolism protein/1,5-bisphosphokinase (PRPP-forming) PhnN [Hyphomicrobiaceae bacterium]
MAGEGPSGRLVLVVGPSGAGKDAVMSGAKARLADDPDMRFPKRMVTRAVSGSEDHDSCDAATFARLASDGAFVLTWEAHGLSYGLPASILNMVHQGKTVVMNGSRTVIAAARAIVPTVAVEITAPAEVLAARIAARGRASDGGADGRLKRSEEIGPVAACDVVIDNSGTLRDAIDRFVAVLRADRVA